MGFVYFRLCRCSCFLRIFLYVKGTGEQKQQSMKMLKQIVGKSTLWIFSVHVEIKRVKGGWGVGGGNQGLYVPMEKGLQTSLCLQECLVGLCSLLGKCQKRLSDDQRYSSLLMFQWPSSSWGGAPCSRGCELLCCLQACLLQSSFLILLGRDILLGQRSSAGLWLSCWC